MATTKQRLKVPLILITVVFVNLIRSTSAQDGLLSRLYKKAASKNRPLVLVIDNPDSTFRAKSNDRAYSAEDGGRGKSVLPYLLLQKQDQSYDNLDYRRPQKPKSRNYRNRYSDRRERNRYDRYNRDRQSNRYDRDEDRTEEYVYDRYRSKYRDREVYDDRRERNHYRPRSNSYRNYNERPRLRTKDQNFAQDVNQRNRQGQGRDNQDKSNREDQDRRDRPDQDRHDRHDHDRRDRQDQDRHDRPDQDRRDRQEQDRRDRPDQDRRDRQDQDRRDRQDEDRRDRQDQYSYDRYDQDRRDRPDQDRRDRHYDYHNRATSGKGSNDDTSGASAQIPVVKKLLRSLNCAARDECEDTCGESYNGPKKDECQNECDQKFECEEEDEYVDPCLDCGGGGGCGEDTCSGSTKGTVLSNEDTGCKRC